MSEPRFEVSIAAHYVPRRIPYLIEVLDAIALWDRPQVSVTLVTNDLSIGEEPLIEAARTKLEERGFTLHIDQAHGMAHPWHLTWWHKQRLKEWFAEEGSPDDLFMYIEDDIVVTRDNIAYFTQYLEAAKSQGVLPGFLRYEEEANGRRISPDYRGYQQVGDSERRTLNDQPFVAPQFSYWAGFIVDRELCAEYFASPWSDLEAADKMPQSKAHSCRVQSAWALTFVNVPEGLPSRYVVPIDEDGNPLECGMVWHSANNYSASKDLNFGTVAMNDIFHEPSLIVAARQMMWEGRALLRRAVTKLKKITTSA
ncbi:MAG: hypothetical protein AAFQ13_04900 [Pseudomonadota bacterium]